MARVTRSRRWGTRLRTTLAILACLTLCFPIYWMFVISFRERVYQPELDLLPESLDFASYVALVTEFPFTGWLLNTVYVAVGATVVSLLLAVPAAYSLARFSMRGHTAVNIFVLTSQMLPVSLLIVPYYIIWSQLGLLDSVHGLLIANVAICLPVAVWMLKGFFESIPPDAEDAARVDGANRFQALWRITVPMALPGILAAGAFCFIFSWTEYIFATTLVAEPSNMILSGGLAREMFEESSIRWGLLMAGSLLATLPAMLVVGPIQKYIVSGLTGGAVKG